MSAVAATVAALKHQHVRFSDRKTDQRTPSNTAQGFGSYAIGTRRHKSKKLRQTWGVERRQSGRHPPTPAAKGRGVRFFSGTPLRVTSNTRLPAISWLFTIAHFLGVLKIIFDRATTVTLCLCSAV